MGYEAQSKHSLDMPIADEVRERRQANLMCKGGERVKNLLIQADKGGAMRGKKKNGTEEADMKERGDICPL
ncbi:hypothetical protein HanRHA438_Chr09g0406151 [Helianthus annuus]|nr:hypothetical protein HanRHA438_Chr09g0406151 [Helianthus annuus]